jgi:hypothetical protein
MMRNGVAAELGGLGLTVPLVGAIQVARYDVADCAIP